MKFLNRVWRVQDNLKDKADPALVRAMHKAIKKITEDVEGFKFNTAIASMMELTNTIYQLGADKEVFSNLIIMLAPVAPHFCEELWHILGNKESISKAAWPKYDPALIVDETVTIIVQVNGKVRSRLDVPSDIPEEKLKELVLSDEKLIPWMQGKPPRNMIIVPRKLVNIVV
jgi:leucyl-tRNA synthetase